MSGRDGWVDVCEAAGLSSEQGRCVTVEGRELAVFIDREGNVRVTDDRCPHAGGSLSGGYLDEGGCVVCPWHGWPFDAGSGCCPDNPSIRVRTYVARVEGGRVWVRVDGEC